jgi:lipopolysaccharide transport system permease protein
MAADVIVIEPSKGWIPLRMHDLWSYRELILFLVWRDLKLRYKQTVLGASWAVLQPLVTTLLFTVVFGNWLGLGGGLGGPYALFAFAAMVAWTFFSTGLGQGSRSLTVAATVISRVYFPRLVLPIGAVLASLVDLVIASCFLIVLMAFYGYTPGIELLGLPAFVLLLVALTLGLSFLLGALNAQYRDVGYVTPFLLQLWFFATPIVYPLSIVPDWIRESYSLTPMVSIVSGFRWAFLGDAFPAAGELAVSCASTALILVAGAFYFRRMERTVVDVV